MPVGIYDRTKSKPNSGMFGKGENHPFYGKHHTEEWKKARSGKNHPLYGKHLSDDYKEKIKLGMPDMSGENNPMYDKHHSKETIEKIKKAISGENNPNYGKHRSKEMIEKLKKTRILRGLNKPENSPNYGKHFSKKHREKIGKANRGKHMNVGENNPNYGKRRTEEWKSIHSRGAKNPMYGRPTPYSKGAYYKGIWMRSTWEIKIAKWLDKQNWKWLYESRRFELKDRTYSPDFYLPEQNVWWEIKGWFNKETQEKISQFRELYPYEKIVIITEEIYKTILNTNCERI